jgi:transcriptional regulator with XRE-family HTH domain
MGGKRPWDQRRLRLQKLLRDVRLEAGLKQEEVAERIGSDQSFVSRYERGERRLDLVELEAICTACKMKLEEFARRYSASRR